MLTLFFFSLNRTGIFSTLLLPETKGKTLEELSGEDDQDHFISAPSGAERV
jgi:PHS family inorganic phosphate transporter-like MFS transporter